MRTKGEESLIYPPLTQNRVFRGRVIACRRARTGCRKGRIARIRPSCSARIWRCNALSSIEMT